VSTDASTVAWGAEKGMFVWPAAEPLPASPKAIPSTFGSVSVAGQTLLHCDEQSCLVTRVAP